jgi:aminopeptidase N
VSAALLIALLAAAAPGAQQVDLQARPQRVEPSRDFDVEHYRVTLGFDLEARSFTGENRVTLTALRDGWDRCLLHATGLRIDAVRGADGAALAFRHEGDEVWIDFPRPRAFGERVEFTVAYRGHDPERGLYFDDETAEHPRMVSTDSFPDNARRWIPLYDQPHDKVTQEMIVTAPRGNRILSNGRLVGVTEDAAAGTTTWHWSQELPHSTYLFMLAIGPFERIEDEYEGIPVTAWVYPQDVEDARWIFAKTPEMLRFYSELFDYPYPWAKYDQVTTPHVGGGAEATSATVLGQQVIHDRRAEQDFSWEWILAHEIAHHWWGDLTTLREWSHTWMNESFATYSDHLYTRHAFGEDAGAWDLKGKKEQYLHEARTRYMRPIVFDRWESPGDNFDRHTYPKGAAVLHMLRFELGDAPFFAVLRRFLREHAFQPVDTHDFLATVKDTTGRNLDAFLGQFLFHPGHPVFEVAASWDEAAGELELRVDQVQDTSRGVPVYDLPVEVGLTTAAGKQVVRLRLDEAEEVFRFPLPAPPLLVRFDEGNHLLKEWRFPKGRAELLFQARHDDAIGREWAVRQLGDAAGEAEVREVLRGLAGADPFWAVRAAAVEALGAADPAAHRGVLLASTEDPHSQVRVAALRALLRAMDPTDLPVFRQRFAEDDSYVVQAEALRAIGRVGSAADLPLLEAASQVSSPRQVLARAAAEAIASIRRRG